MDSAHLSGEAWYRESLKQSYPDMSIQRIEEPRANFRGNSRHSPQKQPVTEEFIQNLKQQIHYLQNDIRTYKQKEIERSQKFNYRTDTGPLSESMMAITNKYQSLQTDLDNKLENLTIENRELYGKTHTLKTNVEKLRDQINLINRKIQDETAHFDIQSEKFRVALSSVVFKKEETQKLLNDALRQRDDYKNYAGKTRIKIDRGASELSTLDDKLAHAEAFNQQILQEKNNQIIELTGVLLELEEDLQQQKTYKKLQGTLNRLVNQRQEIQMDRDNLANKIKTLKYSNEISQKNYHVLLQEKAQLQNKLEEMKIVLDRERTDQDKLIEIRVLEKEKREIAIANSTLDDARQDSLQHSERLKSIINRNTDIFEQKSKLTFDIAEVKEKLGSVQKVYEQVKAICSQRDARLQNMNQKIEIFKERVRNIQNRKLEEELQGLSAQVQTGKQEEYELEKSKEFLLKKFQLNSQLKNIDLEELKMLSKSNVEVNQTISQLINKWETIQGQSQY